MSPLERLEKLDKRMFVAWSLVFLGGILLESARRQVGKIAEATEVLEDDHQAEVHGLRSRLDSLLEELHDAKQGGAKAKPGADQGKALAEQGGDQGEAKA